MNKKLYVGNLPFTAEENQLLALFGNEGRQVASVRILSDKLTGRSRGFGFVEMKSLEDAQKAMAALNGKDFMGRSLIVHEAREQGSKDNMDGEIGSHGRNLINKIRIRGRSEFDKNRGGGRFR